VRATISLSAPPYLPAHHPQAQIMNWKGSGIDLANTSDSWWNGVKARRGAAATSTGQCGSVYSLRDLKRVIQFFSRDQTNSVMDSTFILSARKLRIFRWKLLPSCRSCTLKMGARLRSEFGTLIPVYTVSLAGEKNSVVQNHKRGHSMSHKI
jgi:hypothetical protein